MTRRETPLDAAALLRTLADQQVDYVVIGGVAMQAHGHLRTTMDLDVMPAPGADNIARLAAALESLDARGVGPTPPRWSLADLSRGEPQCFDTTAGGIDVDPCPTGAAPYPEIRSRALVLDVVGVEIAVAGRDDLIAMKLASGRPVDRADVRFLADQDLVS